MAEQHTSALDQLFDSIHRGNTPATTAWQLSLQEGQQGWPADVRELVSLGGDVIAAGNHWIIVTDELREDIVAMAGESVAEPVSVTIVMLNDLPQDIVSDPQAMDQIQAAGWMTATGDALVIPREQTGSEGQLRIQ